MKKILPIFLVITLVLANPGFAKKDQIRVDESDILMSINLPWWMTLNDPILVNHIDHAVTNNKDLQIALLEVQKQRAIVRETFAKELPTLNLLANFIRFRPDFTGQPDVTYENAFSGFFLPTYEIDIMQKNRRKTKSQEQILEGNLQDARAAYLTIAAEVAGSYVNVLSLDKSIIFQEEVLSLDRQRVALLNAKYSTGLIPYGQVLNAEVDMRDSEVLLAELKKAREVFLNQLAVLTGKSPEESSTLPRGDFDTLGFVIPPDISVPSEKIMQRPDILKAEALIKRAKLDVEFARRDFLPNLNLYGLLGFNTLDLSKTTNVRNYITAVGTGFFHPIFQGGARFARLRRAKYDYEQILTDYQQTILTSLQEVNDTLVNLKSDVKISQEIDEKLSAEEQDLYLVNLKYERGLISCLDTLADKKQVLMLSQDSTQRRANYFLDYIDLYKALAGNI